MPNFNGLVPNEAGSMSGRGLGPCGGGQAIRRGFGHEQGSCGAGRGFGRGAGYGRGWNLGPGLGRFAVGYGSEDSDTRAEGLRQALEARVTLLRAELARAETLLKESQAGRAGEEKR